MPGDDRDDRPLDIARRLADGEDVDLTAANEGLDTELARGLEKLRKVMGAPEGTPSDATPTQSIGAATPPSTPSQSGDYRRIAGFKLIRKLGEGGMGVV